MDWSEVVWDGSEAQLAAMAEAADAASGVAPDAVPWEVAVASRRSGLPEWYMPAPVARLRHRGTATVIAVVVLGFLVIDAFGLCVTSGFPTWA